MQICSPDAVLGLVGSSAPAAGASAPAAQRLFHILSSAGPSFMEGQFSGPGGPSHRQEGKARLSPSLWVPPHTQPPRLRWGPGSRPKVENVLWDGDEGAMGSHSSQGRSAGPRQVTVATACMMACRRS